MVSELYKRYRNSYFLPTYIAYISGFQKAKNRTSRNFCKVLKPLSNSNRGNSSGCMTLEWNVCQSKVFFSAVIYFLRESYLAIRFVNVKRKICLIITKYRRKGLSEIEEKCLSMRPSAEARFKFDPPYFGNILLRRDRTEK